jgi:glucose/arabinose dehydrogenase
VQPSPSTDGARKQFPSTKPVPFTEERVLRQQHNLFGNHNGGDLTFGPDGYLYWSTGDGGSGDDPLCGAQDLSTLLGTIVRIDAMHDCGDRP